MSKDTIIQIKDQRIKVESIEYQVREVVRNTCRVHHLSNPEAELVEEIVINDMWDHCIQAFPWVQDCESQIQCILQKRDKSA